MNNFVWRLTWNYPGAMLHKKIEGKSCVEPLDKRNRIINISFRTFMRYPRPIHVYERKEASRYVQKTQYKDYPQIWYCREGEYTHETEHGTYLCKKGSVVIVPPGITHCLRVPGEGKATLLRIDLTFDYLAETGFEAAPNTAALLFLPVFLRELGHPVGEHYMLSEASQAETEERIAVLTSDEQAEPLKRASLEEMLSLPEFALPEEVRQLAEVEAKTKLAPVLRALVYIQANFAQKITAEQLCQVSSLCRTNLFRLIRQYLGISWASYLVMLRVVRANYALVHTNYSIAYIADMCGFSHSSHMSKCYKRYKGILPKEDRMKQKLYQWRYGKIHITHEFFMDDFFD